MEAQVDRVHTAGLAQVLGAQHVNVSTQLEQQTHLVCVESVSNNLRKCSERPGRT